MDINKFVTLRPCLYHITDELNLEIIRQDLQLKSTANLVRMLELADADNFLRTRRVGHKKLRTGNLSISIRDQDPLSEKIASKNLEDGISFSDFVYMLNSRVFFWAKEKDMIGHYTRYSNQNEYPVILKLSTKDLFDANINEPQFCRLNSGAPRCSSYYKEGAPPRGRNTFVPAHQYEGLPSSVREVTFENFCQLPENILIAKKLGKSFKPLL